MSTTATTTGTPATYMVETERVMCNSCWNGPCNDGTGCSERYRDVFLKVMVVVGPDRCGDPLRKLAKPLDDHFKHPRYQEQPRSPKRRR